jgi:predicted ATPase
MMEAVHRYEGTVNQVMGDGIMALFGAPLAHEDHAARACYAALRMHESVKRYAEEIQRSEGIPLQIRVGLNSGEVVVRSIGNDLHMDYTAVGQTTHLAARMEQVAMPGSTVVSEQSHKLTEGFFQFKGLGAAQVKGVSEPLDIYELVDVGPLRTRLEVAARRGLVRFVGRQPEMEQMRRALDLAKGGRGQIVGVMGEPGVGKSRLFYEFKILEQSGCLVMQAFSASHGKAYPYLPLIELLKDYFQITPQDGEQTRREKVAGKVVVLDRTLEDTLPYLFFLLGISEQGSSLQQMDAQIRRQRTFEAIKRLLLRGSLIQALLLVFEDLHWVDGETQAFLDFLSESVASARILLLVNYRPEYQHSWVRKTYYSQLRLDPLGSEDAQELLTALLGDGARLTAVRTLILEKTEGNPFFMEEVVQTLAEEKVLLGERGDYRMEKPASELQIPATVQVALAARIDRLGVKEKELLQTLAVIGRQFSFNLLKGVVDDPEEELYQLLSHLQGGEFIYEQPTIPDVEYVFKHALTQEVAYNSVLVERRRILHERTAQAMERVYRDQLEEHYSDLAHHYSRSENTEKAVDYLKLAGQQAVQRSANAEAVSYLTTALELLKKLPDTPERKQRELTLQITLGVPLVATKGHGAPEMEKAYTRARELCQQVGETPQLFPVLFGLWRFYSLRADSRTTRELAEQLMSLARNTQDPELLLEAHRAMGATLFYLGEVVPAQAHLERAIALYDPQQHRSHAFLYGIDPGVYSLTHLPTPLWLLGYPDQALKRMQEAITLARSISHPFSLAFAMSHASRIHEHRREIPAYQELTEALMALANDQGVPQWWARGNILRGWAMVEQEQFAEGIAQMRQGLAAFRPGGVELYRPYYLILLAEACGKAGQIEEGLNTLAEALDTVNRTGERWYEAELYRIKGELLLVREGKKAKGKKEAVLEAEACFSKAIDLARSQSAKSLELRAVRSLSRLWQKQDKKDEARKLLQEIYGWFTEGFDTADLKEAKALLEELS